MASTTPSLAPIAVSRARAAEMLDVSRQHIVQLEERGVLRALRVHGSRSVRIPIEDVYAAVGLTPPECNEVNQ